MLLELADQKSMSKRFKEIILATQYLVIDALV